MSQEATIPKLADVGKKALSVAADLQVHALLELFQGDPELLTIAIADDGVFLGSASRKELLNLLSRKFAMDLYAKKPVSALLDDLGGKKIVLGPELDINEAAVRLLSLDPTLQTDAFPIVRDGHCVGVVAVSDLMMAVAEQQRGLLEALDRLSSRIREEVARGVKIQQDLLPPPGYHFQGVSVGAGIATCSEIGGDFYDYFSVGEDVLGLLIADVSGHGVQAGMVTTAAKASLHTLISLGVTTPSGLLAGMNNAILATARQTLLMTCLIASIDLSSGTITIANAGHNFPVILRKGDREGEMLDATAGFPLGFERDARYPETSTSFAPGDSFFMYTDGIVESTDASGEEFGYERFLELLAAGRELPPHELHDFLLDGVAAYSGTSLFEDDVTTLVARYEEDVQRP
jgi:phosphoserine phosphatase RsbU/P